MPPKPTNWGKKPNEKEYEFLGPVITSNNEVDKRLVHMYEKQDMWRTKKWALANPKVAEKQNIEQLKKLIVINLTKPRQQKIQALPSGGMTPILSLAEIRRRKLARRTKQNLTDGEQHEVETAMNASMNSSIQMV